MKKLLYIILLLVSVQSFAQTTPYQPVQVNQMTWVKDYMDRMWAFRGATLGYKLFPDSAQVARMISGAVPAALTFNNAITKAGATVGLGSADGSNGLTRTTIIAQNGNLFAIGETSLTPNGGQQLSLLNKSFALTSAEDTLFSTVGAGTGTIFSRGVQISANKFNPSTGAVIAKQVLGITGSQMYVLDQIRNKGLEAAGNYESNYTSKSYTSKRFADSLDANNVHLTGFSNQRIDNGLQVYDQSTAGKTLQITGTGINNGDYQITTNGANAFFNLNGLRNGFAIVGKSGNTIATFNDQNPEADNPWINFSFPFNGVSASFKGNVALTSNDDFDQKFFTNTGPSFNSRLGAKFLGFNDNLGNGLFSIQYNPTDLRTVFNSTNGTPMLFNTTGGVGSQFTPVNPTDFVRLQDLPSATVPQSYIGTLYNKNTWTNLADFAASPTATVSASSGTLNFSGGANDFNQTLNLLNYTILDKWIFSICGSPTVVNSTSYGFGVGLGRTPIIVKFDATTGGGTVKMYAGAGNQLVFTSSAIAFSANDKISISLTRDGNYFVVSAFNLTTNSAVVTGSFFYNTTVVNSPNLPNTGQPFISSFGGAFSISSISFTSKALKNAAIAIVGDSKTQGYVMSDQSLGYANILGSLMGNYLLHSGEGDKVSDELLVEPELLAASPKFVLDNMGSNDIRAGASVSSVMAMKAILHAGRDALGIRTIELSPFYELVGGGGIDLSPLNDAIKAAYPNDYIDGYNLIKRNSAASLFTDGVHINDYGQPLIANYVNLKLDSMGYKVSNYVDNSFKHFTSITTPTLTLNNILSGNSKDISSWLHTLINPTTQTNSQTALLMGESISGNKFASLGYTNNSYVSGGDPTVLSNMAFFRAGLNATNGLNIGTNGAAPITFSQNTVNTMTLSAARNVLIGTTTDAATGKLQLTGNFALTGNQITTGNNTINGLFANNIGTSGIQSSNALGGLIWSLHAPGTATSGNYAFAFDGTTTRINAPTGGSIIFRNNNGSTLLSLSATAMQVNYLTAGLPVFTDGSKNLTNTGTMPVANGGTGSTTAPSSTQIMVATSATVFTPRTISGDMTNDNSGVFTIGANKVTYAKMQAMTANRLLGSGLSGTAVNEIALGTGLSFTGTTLNATGGSGTVTGITPGYGFTSATPITTSGTMTIDTSKLQTVLNLFPKSDRRYERRLKSFYTDVASTTSPADAYVYTVPANTLIADGQVINAEYTAFEDGTTGTETLLFYFAGIQILNTGAIAPINGSDRIRVTIIRDSPTTFKSDIWVQRDGSAFVFQPSQHNSGIFDPTATNDIKFNITSSTTPVFKLTSGVITYLP